MSQKHVIAAPICPVHQVPGKLTDSAVLYGRTKAYRQVWLCQEWPRCDFRVGSDPDGAPLGTMADEPLRKLRISAHFYFDGWWRRNGIKRGQAYRELAALFLKEEAHISQMDAEECQRVIDHYKAKVSQ